MLIVDSAASRLRRNSVDIISPIGFDELLPPRNRLEQGIAHKPVIVEVFHDLRGDYRVVYHDLCLGGPTAKGVGLHVASSHTVNHREDDFIPLETIRRFLGFFNSFPGGKWLTFSKRPEKCIPNHLPKVITHIEDWKGRFFFVQDSVVPSTYPKLLSKDNRWDNKSFGDKLLDNIHKNPFFQYLEMSFRNFMYAENDDDLSFLPKEASVNFGTGSPSVSINTEHPVVECGCKDKGKEVQNQWGLFEASCQVQAGLSTSRYTRAKAAASKDDSAFLTIFDDDKGILDCLELENASACHLKVSAITPPAWKNHLDNQLDVELLDLHDRCYAKQVVVDNAVNKRPRELLKVIDQIRAECDLLKDREKERDHECEELKAKYEAAMADFDRNPAVNVLCEEIASLSGEVTSLEAEKVKLEVVKASLRQESHDAKLDRAEVISKVVPYVAMELVNSDDMDRLVAKLVSASILYGRCHTFEEVVKMKDPFDITKVKGYRVSNEDLREVNVNFMDVRLSVDGGITSEPYVKVNNDSPWLFLSRRSANIPSLNCLSSFDVIAFGTPNLHMTCSHVNFSACFLFAVVTGLASTHFVKCSTAIARDFKFPRAVGRGPKIIPMHRWPIVTLLHNSDHHGARLHVKSAISLVYFFDDVIRLRRAYTSNPRSSFGSSGSKPLNRTSTNTSLVRCSKVIEANLISASAFFFWFLLTCLIVKVSKPFRTSFTFSKYCLNVGCLASKIPFIWLVIIYESVKLARLLISISRAICNPTSNASYSASLFVVSNSKRRAYVYSLPSRLISISHAPEPSKLDASSV
ncbi:hypothetical protein Tco_1303986 [Tanacetum coccineum]